MQIPIKREQRVLPNWRVFMIQFLNIDGTGSIFGAVMVVRNKKCFWITLIPALFMTTVCTTFFFLSKQMLGLPEAVAYPMGIACLIAACVWFAIWSRKESQK